MSNISEVKFIDTEAYKVLKDYVNPAVYAMIIAFGLMVNGLLMWIIVRHREVRTTASIMIVNVAVCDVLNLSITAPILCLFHFPHDDPSNVTGCRIHLAVRQFLSNLSALSLVALCIQRFCVTIASLQLKINSLHKSFSQRTLNVFYITLLWSVSAALAMPLVLVESVYSYLCGSNEHRIPTCITLIVYFFMFSLVLPSVMITFSVITARRLRKSLIKIPCELRRKSQEHVRNRSATVVLCLGFLFVLSHFPMWTWSVMSFWTDSDFSGSAVIISEYLTKYLVFLDSCFNPVALYFASGTFRKFFRKYLCCYATDTEEVQSCNTSRTSIPTLLSDSSV